MYLLLSILLALILGYALLLMGPMVGGFFAFAIITGTLFRGLYLLNDIHRRITKDIPKPDPVKEAYENYLKEKESKVQG
ncbi:hypothetical protein ACQCU1_16125 [Sutcliffiella horikoshii]|uniref:hypothetical protein n=1 Tax=Sutcliffiella horikoshii TaxID=79883 RepID=UPI003CF8A3FC